MTSNLRTLTILAGLALTFVWFAGLDHRTVIKPDEARYGEIAREMVASGDWVTPRLNDLKYFEKPPLQYWATAAAYALFGVNEWTTRLWTALTGFACVLLVFYFANRTLGPPVGLYAAAALAGSGLFVFVGQFSTLDMGLTFFLTLAVFAAILGQLSDAPRHRRGWMWLAWAAMALATLSKGLIGIVLPLGALALYVLWQRDWGRLRSLHLVSGLLVLLALAAPWFVAVSMENPEFARFFFIHEHFERFTSKVHGRYEPAWYFFPILLVSITPWLLSLVTALWQAMRAATRGTFHPLTFLLAWSVAVFGFFSVSGSKLPSYILPIFPALAVLIGWQLARADRRFLVWQSALAVLGGAGFIVFGVFAARSSNTPHELLANYRPWLIAAGATLAAAAAASAISAWNARRSASILALAFGGLVSVKLILLGHDALAELYSARQLVEQARPALPAAASPEYAQVPFYAVDVYDHSMPFYLGRTLTMVHYSDELGLPATWEPQKFVPTVAEFVALWARAPRAYAILRPEQLATMRREHALPADVVAAGRRLVMIRKP